MNNLIIILNEGCNFYDDISKIIIEYKQCFETYDKYNEVKKSLRSRVFNYSLCDFSYNKFITREISYDLVTLFLNEIIYDDELHYHYNISEIVLETLRGSNILKEIIKPRTLRFKKIEYYYAIKEVNFYYIMNIYLCEVLQKPKGEYLYKKMLNEVQTEINNLDLNLV